MIVFLALRSQGLFAVGFGFIGLNCMPCMPGSARTSTYPLPSIFKYPPPLPLACCTGRLIQMLEGRDALCTGRQDYLTNCVPKILQGTIQRKVGVGRTGRLSKIHKSGGHAGRIGEVAVRHILDRKQAVNASLLESIHPAKTNAVKPRSHMSADLPEGGSIKQ